MLISPRPTFYALLPGIATLALLTAVPASAQILILGTYNGTDPTSSATATIGIAGTVVGVNDPYRFLGGASAATTAYKTVTVNNASSLTMLDGSSISNTLSVFNTGTADISSGSVTSIKGYDSSVITIQGGSVTHLTALGSSSSGSNGGIPGGGIIDIYGGSLTDLTAENGGLIDIFGTGLTETFFATSSPFKIYDVAGTLQDGTTLNVKYSSSGGSLLFNGQTAVPTLPAVPEASTTVSFGLLLMLGLGSLTVASRKNRVIGQAA